MRAKLRELVWPSILVVASAVVAWSSARGAFLARDLFPTVFAGVVAICVGAELLLALRARLVTRAVLVLIALGLAGYGAVAHNRVRAERRALSEQRGVARWLDREIASVTYWHGWNTLAASGRLAIGRGTTLLNLWGTWCPPCVREMPHLDEVWRRHHAADDFQILGLTTDFSARGEAGLTAAREEVAAFLSETAVGYPILLLEHGDFAAFAVESYPTTLWLEDGVVRGYFVGIDGTFELLDRLGL